MLKSADLCHIALLNARPARGGLTYCSGLSWGYTANSTTLTVPA